MEYLNGGRVNQIARSGGKLYRPAGEWTPHVHQLLTHIRAQGFLGAPQPLGFDDAGNEIVSYIPGEVSNYPLSDAAASDAALISAAQLLCAYHDATVSLLSSLRGDEAWLLPARDPQEVICHGDFAPYNVVLEGSRAVAIIDFDTAHPGPRAWDLAYALYRWAPLTNPHNHDGFGSLQQQIARSCLFCDAYGVSTADRAMLTSAVIERLLALVDFMHAAASSGAESFQQNIAAGHHLLYIADAEYVKAHAADMQAGLMADQ